MRCSPHSQTRSRRNTDNTRSSALIVFMNHLFSSYVYVWRGSGAALGQRTESMSFYRDRHQGPIPHISNKIVFFLLLAVCSTYLSVHLNLRWISVLFNLHLIFAVKIQKLRVWFLNKHTTLSCLTVLFSPSNGSILIFLTLFTLLNHQFGEYSSQWVYSTHKTLLTIVYIFQEMRCKLNFLTMSGTREQQSG